MKNAEMMILGEATNAARIKAISDRFAGITIGKLAAATHDGLVSEPDFPEASLVVSISVAMAFMANIDPECRCVAAESFITAFCESLRGSVDAQNLHDTKPEGRG